MRKLLLSLCTSLSFCASMLGASAQSSTSDFVGFPFVAGSPYLFTTALLNLNYNNFFAGLLPNGQSINPPGLWMGRNSSDALAAAGKITLADLANQPVTTPTTQSQLTIIMTGFINSSNPATNSTGIYFPNTNNTTINSVSFQYSPLSGTTGLVTNDFTQAPLLAITDEGGARTRLLNVTQGLLATNAALNAYNTVFNGSTTNTTSTSATKLNEGFLTSTFTTAQLGIEGQVTALGLVYDRAGVVIVNNFSVNGATEVAVSTENGTGYPF